MSWQDVVFAIGQLVFGVALVPALMDRAKPPLLTSVPTAAVLLSFGATFATLGFVWSMTASLICGGAWWILAAQRLLQTRKRMRRPSIEPARQSPTYGEDIE